MVLEPTRENNALDHILTNAPQLIPRIEIVTGLSDHDIPFWRFIANTIKEKQAQKEYPNYKQRQNGIVWEKLPQNLVGRCWRRKIELQQ